MGINYKEEFKPNGENSFPYTFTFLFSTNNGPYLALLRTRLPISLFLGPIKKFIGLSIKSFTRTHKATRLFRIFNVIDIIQEPRVQDYVHFSTVFGIVFKSLVKRYKSARPFSLFLGENLKTFNRVIKIQRKYPILIGNKITRLIIGSKRHIESYLKLSMFRFSKLPKLLRSFVRYISFNVLSRRLLKVTLSTKEGLISQYTYVSLVGAVFDEIGRVVIGPINEIGRVLSYLGPTVEHRLVIRKTRARIGRLFSSAISLLSGFIYSKTKSVTLTALIGLLTDTPTIRETYLRRFYDVFIKITPIEEGIEKWNLRFQIKLGILSINSRIFKAFYKFNLKVSLLIFNWRRSFTTFCRTVLSFDASRLSIFSTFNRRLETLVDVITLLYASKFKAFLLETSLGVLYTFTWQSTFIRGIETSLGNFILGFQFLHPTAYIKVIEAYISIVPNIFYNSLLIRSFNILISITSVFSRSLQVVFKITEGLYIWYFNVSLLRTRFFNISVKLVSTLTHRTYITGFKILKFIRTVKSFKFIIRR